VQLFVFFVVGSHATTSSLIAKVSAYAIILDSFPLHNWRTITNQQTLIYDNVHQFKFDKHSTMIDELQILMDKRNNKMKSAYN
jgi:hypothetical protein